MPLGGVDQRYNLSWEEQDKIRRRLEMKAHLKQEGVTKRFSPYLMLKHEIFQDPAIERYMDLRRRGRLPNTPLKPQIFYGMLGIMLIPTFLIGWFINEDRWKYVEGCHTGDIPYSERDHKGLG